MGRRDPQHPGHNRSNLQRLVSLHSQNPDCVALTFSRLVQLNHAIDGSNSHLGRDLRATLEGDNLAPIRLGSLFNVGGLTFVGDNSVAVRLGGLLNVRSLAFVGDDAIAIGLGSLLNVRSLTFVNSDDSAIRLDGLLDRGGLTLLNTGLEGGSGCKTDKRQDVCVPLWAWGEGQRRPGQRRKE